ncbi:hypothetical protein Bca4012_083797 [Brassica carinata]
MYIASLKGMGQLFTFLFSWVIGMVYELLKHILPNGAEVHFDKITNSCTILILRILKKAPKDEYEEVLNPFFSPVLAISENRVKFSRKAIHSFICKHFKVFNLHELWFVFAKRPFRFSMQEFHDVTGLKYEDEPNIDFENWKDDKGFWSKVLKKNGKISIKNITKGCLF